MPTDNILLWIFAIALPVILSIPGLMAYSIALRRQDEGDITLLNKALKERLAEQESIIKDLQDKIIELGRKVATLEEMNWRVLSYANRLIKQVESIGLNPIVTYSYIEKEMREVQEARNISEEKP